MFVNAYELTLERGNGDTVDVALRLGVGGQLKLKKKWNESTTDTLFTAVDDVERFVDLMTQSLNFTGNKNTIQSGEELIDLMAMNDLLGMTEKQKIITSLGRVSGIFSEKEKQAIDLRAEAMIDGAFADDLEIEDTGKKGKN